VPITQVDKIVRVTWVWALLNGSVTAEQADMGVCYRAGAVPTDPDVMNAVLHDMGAAACASVAAHLHTNYYSDSIVLDHVRVALEDTHGLTLFEQLVPADGDLAFAGTGSGTCLPWDNSLVVSLYAYQPNTFDPAGRSKRGRFYTPPPNISILLGDGTGEVDNTSAANLLTDWLTILKELQEHDYSGFPTFSPVLVVNSRRTVSAPAVTYLRIDNKMDRQSRRLKSQAATQQAAPFPGT
jgi:hypothetical protein